MICFLKCFQIIIVLHRQMRFCFCLSKANLWCWKGCVDLLWMLLTALQNMQSEFAWVSLSTLKVSFLLKIKWNRKKGEIFFQLWMNINLIYQIIITIFVPVSDAIFIFENRVYITVGIAPRGRHCFKLQKWIQFKSSHQSIQRYY